MSYLNTGRLSVINSANEYVLGNCGPGGGSMLIHMESSSFSGSITIKARATKPTSASAALAELPIPYTRLNVAGSVSDGTVVSDAITNTGIFQVIVADGMDIILDCTSYASGSMTVHANPSS